MPLAVAALADRETEQIALQFLRDLGGPEQAGAVADLAKRNPSLEVLTAAVQTLTTWRERTETTPPSSRSWTAPWRRFMAPAAAWSAGR